MKKNNQNNAKFHSYKFGEGRTIKSLATNTYQQIKFESKKLISQ